jgi:transketolase
MKIMTNKSYFQRDEFIKTIYQKAKINKNIHFLSADFGAPALDDFRKNLSSQFLHMGISEQNMVDFACGMSMEGSKVYIYAMAPFLSLRALEQHKTTTCLMNSDVCSIITGIGLSYANAGPTHYSTEDFASLRSLSNCYIYTASDSNVAKLIAKKTLIQKLPTFVRLDRHPTSNFTLKTSINDINRGYRFLKKGSSKDKKLLIIGHGTIINRALEACNKLNITTQKKIDTVDLIRSKPFPLQLKNKINKYKNILTIDEQTSEGSLGSLIMENCDLYKKNIKCMSLPDKFIFENLGRSKLLDKYGLSVTNIKNEIIKLI